MVNTFSWLGLPFIEWFVCVCGPFDSPHVVDGMVWFTFSFPHMRGGSQHILWNQTFLNAAVCTCFLSNVYFGAGGGIEGLASSNFHPILWKLFIYYVLQTLYENSLTGFSYVPRKGRSVYSMRSKSSHPSDSLFCFGKKKAEPFYSMRSQPCT